MLEKHLLNLKVLADAPIHEYALLSVHAREAISEPFDYTIELLTNQMPDLKSWIGKFAEFEIAQGWNAARNFAGRIYAARRVDDGGSPRIQVHIGPAYHALAYSRATQFIQDKSSIDIFEALTGDVTGLVKSINVAPRPPKRGYAVRYDESELAFLARQLAHDGIMYFFKYDQGAGSFHHKMIVTNKPADYIDFPGGPVRFLPHSTTGAITSLERQYRAAPRSFNHVSFNPNKLDTPFVAHGTASEKWGAVYTHDHETIGYEAMAGGDVATRQAAHDQQFANASDVIHGSSTEPGFQAGGRVEILEDAHFVPRRVVLASVVHSAYDPWMLPNAGPGSYSNFFEAIDSTKTWRPHIATHERLARGPVLGVIDDDGSTATGHIKVDDQFRVPVKISNARDYKKQGLPRFVWLAVQQQWAHGSHGAQFLPRIGTRVIVDFLYGNPDLPFIAGTIYTPSQHYPFDPRKTPTQSGWRSITDGNGKIVQEFRFEDKPGKEEIYLYTGRDYRRIVDQDDWGTVKRDQTLAVERDQKLTVTRDRTVKIDGKHTTDVKKTRTITVVDKNTLESKKEIEIIVGPCSIKLTMSGIQIKAPKIEISADAKLDMKAGGQATLKAPMTQVTGDATLILKGGVVLIN